MLLLCRCVCCRDVFCAGRVVEEDLVRTMKACGGAIQTSVGNLSEDVLGMCELFQEEQIGGERCVCVFALFVCLFHCLLFDVYRYNIFTGCPEAKTCTLILRGGAEQFIEETERSLHDAIMIVRRTIKNDSIVAGTQVQSSSLICFTFCLFVCLFVSQGGGAIEMELSKYLRDYSRKVPGKEQLIIAAVAKSLETIPRQLCENAGFDSTNILNRLRERHAKGDLVMVITGENQLKWFCLCFFCFCVW